MIGGPDRAALLVLPVPTYPGWTATVDGEPAPLVTADAAFASVLVPAGTSEVELRFSPDGLGRSLLVFALTAVFAVVMWFAPVPTLQRRDGDGATPQSPHEG